jgi:hypothetical protein
VVGSAVVVAGVVFVTREGPAPAPLRPAVAGAVDDPGEDCTDHRTDDALNTPRSADPRKDPS